MDKNIEGNYQIAKEIYASYGIDTDVVLKKLATINVSMHCWQGDDGVGFEVKKNTVNTGIMATGNYPGRAKNAKELRQDAKKAFSLIPGKHKFNLHSIYAETEGKAIERNALEYKYFEGWVEWAKDLGIGIDFNPTVWLAALIATISVHPETSKRVPRLSYSLNCLLPTANTVPSGDR